MLNVLRSNERVEAIREMWGALKPGGVLVLMVRSRQDVEKAANKRREGDGWLITNRGAQNFQKGFDFAELKTLVFEVLDEQDYGKVPGLSGVAILLMKSMKTKPRMIRAKTNPPAALIDESVYIAEQLTYSPL